MSTSGADAEPSRATFANMKPNGLYVLLYKDASDDVRFHWALYHFLNQEQGDWKFDIIRPQGRWHPSDAYNAAPDMKAIDDAYADGPLTCALRIAYIDDSARNSVHDLITREDNKLEELNSSLNVLNCRVYVQRACSRLPLSRVVGPDSWDDLQQEVLDLGELWRDDAGTRPVVVVDSRMATSSGPNSDYASE